MHYAEQIWEEVRRYKRDVPKDAGEQTKRVQAQDGVILAALRLVAEHVSKLNSEPRYGNNPPCALVVGGFVRDAVSGSFPKDADMEVYGVDPVVLEELLSKLFPGELRKVGRSFEILKVSLAPGVFLEVQVPHGEERGSELSLAGSDPSISPEHAARFRDFTINTLAYDPLHCRVFDFCGGLADLSANILRVTNPKIFASNPNQVFRGAQFAARLKLKPDEDSFAVMRKLVAENALASIHLQRITDELVKLFLRAEKPALGLDLLEALGVIGKHYPEFAPDEKTWIDTLVTVDRTAHRLARANLPSREQVTVMFAALCSQLTKNIAAGETANIAAKVRGVLQRFTLPTIGMAAVIAMVVHLKLVGEICKGAGDQGKQQPPQPAKRGAPARLFPGGIARNRPQKNNRKHELEAFLERIYPATWEQIRVVYEGSRVGGSDAGIGQALDGISAELESFSLTNLPRKGLLQPEDIVKRFSLGRGPHVGYILGAVEARRYELVTKENALRFLEENIEVILKEAKEAIEGGGSE